MMLLCEQLLFLCCEIQLLFFYLNPFKSLNHQRLKIRSSRDLSCFHLEMRVSSFEDQVNKMVTLNK